MAVRRGSSRLASVPVTTKMVAMVLVVMLAQSYVAQAQWWRILPKVLRILYSVYKAKNIKTARDVFNWETVKALIDALQTELDDYDRNLLTFGDTDTPIASTFTGGECLGVVQSVDIPDQTQWWGRGWCEGSEVRLDYCQKACDDVATKSGSRYMQPVQHNFSCVSTEANTCRCDVCLYKVAG